MIRMLGNGAVTYIKPDMSQVEKLPMTQTLLQMASDDIRSGLNLTPSQVAVRIDTRLVSNQRLWLQELIQTAALIDNVYSNTGLGYHFDAMMIALKNALGWRIVTPVACPSGKRIDSVTRACVDAPVIIPADEIIPIENNDGTFSCPSGSSFDANLGKCITITNASINASLFSGNMVYILIGGLALLLLMGRK